MVEFGPHYPEGESAEQVLRLARQIKVPVVLKVGWTATNPYGSH